MSKNLYWIWLSLKMGYGGEGFAELISHFGSPENIYAADSSELFQIGGNFKNLKIEPLLDKNLEKAYNVEKYCSRSHIEILKYGEPGYPILLTSLKNPPIILYAKGQIKNLDKKVCIGVVGTRSLTEYGRRSAYKIGYELAASGAVVVSGMALGIDSVAACGALDAGGKTVAVLGSGVDHIYPAAHQKLANEIARHGLLLSEYPPLEGPTRASFPKRNRIISGMSQGTLVVEADEHSGALITAKDAILQGRNVYALPGNVNNSSSNGTNSLIKDGAIPITCAADIMENYRYIYRENVDMSALMRAAKYSDLKVGALSAHGVDEGTSNLKMSEKGTISALLHSQKKVDGETLNKMMGYTEYPQFEEVPPLKKRLNEAERSEVQIKNDEILQSLDEKCKSVFEAVPKEKAIGLSEICVDGYDARTIMSALTTLELKGLIEILPGGLYCRK